MAWLYFVALAGQGSQVNDALRVAFGAGKAVQFLFPVAYVWLLARQGLGEPLRLGPFRGGGFNVGLGSGLLVGLGILAVYAFWLRDSVLLASTPEKIFTKLQEFGFATPKRFVALALAISVVHSFLEEYYWRWFVFGRLRRYLPWGGAIALSSLGFMAHHVIVLGVYFPGRVWTLALPFSLGVAIGGAFWSWLYERTGSLAAVWVSHMFVDLAIMAVGFDMVWAFL